MKKQCTSNNYPISLIRFTHSVLLFALCAMLGLSTTTFAASDLISFNDANSPIEIPRKSYIEQATINKALLSDIDIQVLDFIKNGDLSHARNLINQAIDQTDFSENPRTLVNRLIIRATIDRDVGADISALQDLQFAFRLSASTNQQDLIADIAYSIADIHQTRNEHSIALSYIKQALNYYRKQGASNQITNSSLLAISSFLAMDQITLAMDYLDGIKSYVEASENLQQQARYFQYMGEAQLNSKLYSESISTLNIATKLVPSNNPSQLATLHLLLSRAYTALDNMDLAITELIEAFKIANATESSFYLNQALQLHRANLLARLNQFEAAFRLTQNVLNDSNLHKPVAEIKRMLDMHANFQLTLQQQENADLKQENKWKSEQIDNKQMLNRLYFLVIGLLICSSSLLLLLFLRGRKHRLSLEKIAHSDALTGLHSRKRVFELLANNQHLSARTEQHSCVAILDLDFFKSINDNYGHVVGDQVLKSFGELCTASFRKSDIVGRIGGEEFLIVLPNTKLKEATDVFTTFNQKLPSIAEKLKLTLSTTASIGLVQAEQNEEPIDIVKRADMALYEAKHQGRNRVVTGNI